MTLISSTQDRSSCETEAVVSLGVNSLQFEGKEAQIFPDSIKGRVTEPTEHSVGFISNAIIDQNIQAANSIYFCQNPDNTLASFSNQFRLRIALSLRVSKATASSLGGMRSLLSNFHEV